MKLKYLNIIIFAALLIISGACEDDILEKTNPNSPSTSGFYTNPDEAELSINAAYSALQFVGVYNRWWPYLGSARAGESIYTPKQSGLQEVTGLDDFTVLATKQVVREHWQGTYNGILKTNMVIENVPGISFPDENQKNRIMGEAYFLRALYHFLLVRNFGEEIPMYTNVPASTEDYFPVSEAPGVIYDQIIADFTLAKSLLPTVEEYRNTEMLGKISKGAATAFLGKVYLFRGEYQMAADEFLQVINNEVGAYELVERFRDNHDNNNENNLESIFEVQYKYTSGSWYNIGLEDELANEGQMIEQEATMVDGTGNMWWNQEPSANILSEFESTDPRYYKTFWCLNGDTYEEAGVDLSYEQFTSARPGSNGWRKWGRDHATPDLESDVNVRLMRLADVYLMYAECLIEGATGTGTPAEYINKVRDRARNIPDADKYPTIDTVAVDAASQPLLGLLPTVEELMAAAPEINGVVIDNIEAALRHERKVELAYESKLWDDIVRWGIGVEVRGSAFKPWLPIYQGDLDTNPNLKPNSSN